MMTKLALRGEALARAMTERTIGRVAARLSQQLNDAAVDVEDGRLVISGRGLLRRWLTEPALRFIAGAAR